MTREEMDALLKEHAKEFEDMVANDVADDIID